LDGVHRPSSTCVRLSIGARTAQVGTALVMPALPAILRWLLSGRPAQQDVAAEILSNAAEPGVLAAVAATQGAVDALAEMLQGRWESRYWAAACLAQLACCPETDAAVPEARSACAVDAVLPPHPTVLMCATDSIVVGGSQLSSMAW